MIRSYRLAGAALIFSTCISLPALAEDWGDKALRSGIACGNILDDETASSESTEVCHRWIEVIEAEVPRGKLEPLEANKAIIGGSEALFGLAAHQYDTDPALACETMEEAMHLGHPYKRGLNAAHDQLYGELKGDLMVLIATECS
ncbi:hypothetical protein WNY37_03645 [Henriciella sp. AS95]|uniref:hypothetical protein n=1 Tax=Henriciella sp. AS95 TaxID=3135782 RepID=UPI00317605A3